MRVLIIEDEPLAAKRLSKVLANLAPEAQVLEMLDSIEDTVNWLENNPAPDLCFMDIQLADGLSFEIFRQVAISFPVVFTTAYDHYAVDAFRVKGLDYLLKPIQENEVQEALARFRSIQLPKLSQSIIDQLANLRQDTKVFRERFLVKVGEQLRFVQVSETAWFEADSGYVNLMTKDGQRLLLDKSLDQIREELDPKTFFQINRKMIVSLACVSKIHTYLNSRLKLELSPTPSIEVVVSRDRVKGFKDWLDK